MPQSVKPPGSDEITFPDAARGCAPKAKVFIMGVGINVLSWQECMMLLDRWVGEGSSRYVCICNVHSVVSASDDTQFSHVLNEADLATPDGAPLAWWIRRVRKIDQQRINGPDLMWKYCARLAQSHIPVYLYGGADRTLSRLVAELVSAFPGLNIVGHCSPPYRTLSAEEDARIVEEITDLVQRWCGLAWVVRSRSAGWQTIVDESVLSWSA